MLKAGDRVRIKDGREIQVDSYPGWNGTMSSLVGFVGVLESHKTNRSWFKVKGSAGNYTYHRDWLEPVDTLSDLNDDLAKAEAEVARIKAAIAAETQPKAGDVWKSQYGKATVVFVDSKHVYYTFTSGRVGGVTYPTGTNLKDFMEAYKRVDKT